jgi:hypothetical protein
MARRFTKYPSGYVKANMDFSRSYNLGGCFEIYGTEYDQSGEFIPVCQKGANTVEDAAKIVHEYLQDGLDVFVNGDDLGANEVWFDSRHYMERDEIQREIEANMITDDE